VCAAQRWCGVRVLTPPPSCSAAPRSSPAGSAGGGADAAARQDQCRPAAAAVTGVPSPRTARKLQAASATAVSPPRRGAKGLGLDQGLVNGRDGHGATGALGPCTARGAPDVEPAALTVLGRACKPAAAATAAAVGLGRLGEELSGSGSGGDSDGNSSGEESSPLRRAALHARCRSFLARLATRSPSMADVHGNRVAASASAAPAPAGSVGGVQAPQWCAPSPDSSFDDGEIGGSQLEDGLRWKALCDSSSTLARHGVSAGGSGGDGPSSHALGGPFDCGGTPARTWARSQATGRTVGTDGAPTPCQQQPEPVQLGNQIARACLPPSGWLAVYPQAPALQTHAGCGAVSGRSVEEQLGVARLLQQQQQQQQQQQLQQQHANSANRHQQPVSDLPLLTIPGVVGPGGPAGSAADRQAPSLQLPTAQVARPAGVSSTGTRAAMWGVSIGRGRGMDEASIIGGGLPGGGAATSR
jgi:hypothetical protein